MRSTSRTRKRKERERAPITIEACSATVSGTASRRMRSTASRLARWGESATASFARPVLARPPALHPPAVQLAVGPPRYTIRLTPAAEAAAGEGRSLEVIDLRTLSPLDMDPVYDSVRRTGHAIVVHEAHVNLGVGAEVAARISERCFYSLEAPVLRVGGFDTPYPASRVEEDYLPDLDRVLDAVDRSLDF